MIKSWEILLTVADTVTVEARHAGAIRYLYGLPVLLTSRIIDDLFLLVFSQRGLSWR